MSAQASATKLINVRRSANEAAHLIARDALHLNLSNIFTTTSPPSVETILQFDCNNL